MLYVGIDQHKRHLTIGVRDDQGDVVCRRQIKTGWTDVDSFFKWLLEESESKGGYVAIVEVCGFNRWLIRWLERRGCARVYVITAPPRVRQKTDRRDAARLSELLWINRDRIAADERLVNVREIHQTTDSEQHDRQLVRLRHRLGQKLTRVKNTITGILRRHNLEQQCPTKGMWTNQAAQWLARIIHRGARKDRRERRDRKHEDRCQTRVSHTAERKSGLVRL